MQTKTVKKCNKIKTLEKSSNNNLTKLIVKTQTVKICTHTPKKKPRKKSVNSDMNVMVMLMMNTKKCYEMSAKVLKFFF